jgi:hypothetical protein
VEQGSGAWAGPIGDAGSRGDWPSGRGPGTRRTASGDPEESIKVAVMDTRSGRSGGYKLKGPLECKHHRLWATYDWIKGRIHSRNSGLSQSEKRIAS